MKLLVRAVLAQMLVIMLLLPSNVKTGAPPPPGMERPPEMMRPDMMHRGGPPRPGMERRPGMPSDEFHRGPEMMHRGGPPRPGMERRPGMPSGEPDRGPEMPTHVVSGLDTDFKEQEEIDHAVDTINAKSGGNWLLKRVWWEKTEEVYEQIKEVFNKVMDTRMRFISEYNKLNRSLDIFYSEIGIEQGPLRDLLSHAQDLMDKEHKEQGYLNKREQAFVFKLKGKERDLEQLKLDVKAIQELDAKLDEAFEMLFKQIDVCNQYEQKAWDNFKEIARELNDKEARKLYYDTEGLYKDIQKVSEYISGAFSAYFNQSIQSAHDHTAKISSQMNVLKSEGIDLVKQAEILEKDEEPAPKKVAKPKVKKQKGWWYALGESVGKFIDVILSYFPKSVRAWFIKEVKEADTEYKKLKQEGDKEYSKLKKEVDADIAPLEKVVDPDIKSLEKVGGALEKSAQSDMKLIEQEAKKIEDSVFGKPTEAQKKVLGVDDTSKNKPPHLTPIPKTVPVPAHAIPAHPPAPPHLGGHSIPRQMRPMKEHAVEHMPHRPAHPPAPRRNITDHFDAPHRPPAPEMHAGQPHLPASDMHGRPQTEAPHELHNMRRDVHSDVMHHEAPRPDPMHTPERDPDKINALNPGKLGG